ncbi:winged helix-turn-helix transcriptional regulator [Streptomyces millisiae]|uniref:Helix-turn-helix domain-containing protein n=1 Tax=Streptomyces millisiae TaxID=3075542 RepID=A0ABU2LRD2_9ACTN|nr:helix-turn-helix domain-containing protein [Streptomyces sp. DSM 44918]MDT0320156.1 helix-turn-helix domain-containing protein [Streptomyces sp. DSM 44918]
MVERRGEVGELTGRAGPGGERSRCTEPDTAVQRVFNLLGKRWTGVLIAALMGGPGHFTDLRRAVPGISERMLSDRLSELVAMGLLTREVQEGPPLRVTYRLTPSGQELRPALLELTRWAETHLREEDVSECPSQEQLTPPASG